ncbi:hypothetical protein BJX66DRAFT_316269 [Aspergillus keveii]|uniref:Uncharacterized protein n=1 Tax=Aspergillus keveii TaxID=714993 RepID=A0ABR4FNB5_9EURO
MSINAEALFNHLGEPYEVAYGNRPDLDAHRRSRAQAGDPKKGEMRSALVPQLRMHFRSKPHEIGFDMVLLVAEPGGDQL